MIVEGITAAQLRRRSVLVVDDDESLARLVAAMLAGIADTRIAFDGAEALAAVRGGLRPDAIITDLGMPGMDGLTLVARLKEDDAHRRIPVIMLTARSSPRDVVAGINAGVRAYVTKPFKRDELVTKVRRAIGC